VFGWPMFTNASNSTEMGQDCQRSAKAHQIKNCTHWKNVQRQMERLNPKFKKKSDYHTGTDHHTSFGTW